MAQTATERPPAGRRTPPGPGRRGSLRLIGERRRDPLGTFVRLRDAHGPVVSFRMGPLDMYLVTEPDLVQEVFTTHAARVRKGRILQGARVILGDGLLTAEGEHHRRQRRLIQPAFHRERLDGYARIMSRRAAEAADGWADGQVIDVFSEMSALTMGVVGESLFGTGLGEEFDRVEEALVDVFRAFDLLVLPFAGLACECRRARSAASPPPRPTSIGSWTGSSPSAARKGATAATCCRCCSTPRTPTTAPP